MTDQTPEREPHLGPWGPGGKFIDSGMKPVDEEDQPADDEV